MSFVVELLTRAHDRSSLECGEPALDEFIRRRARQNQERDISRTYVARRPAEARAVGFYTLTSGSLAFENVPEPVRRRLPRYPAPVVHLARLAIDRSASGQGLGEALLFDALGRAVRVADALGVFAVEVRTKHERAREFYLKYGFQPLVDDRFNLYLPIATIRGLVEGR